MTSFSRWINICQHTLSYCMMKNHRLIYNQWKALLIGISHETADFNFASPSFQSIRMKMGSIEAQEKRGENKFNYCFIITNFLLSLNNSSSPSCLSKWKLLLRLRMIIYGRNFKLRIQQDISVQNFSVSFHDFYETNLKPLAIALSKIKSTAKIERD